MFHLSLSTNTPYDFYLGTVNPFIFWIFLSTKGFCFYTLNKIVLDSLWIWNFCSRIQLDISLMSYPVKQLRRTSISTHTHVVKLFSHSSWGYWCENSPGNIVTKLTEAFRIWDAYWLVFLPNSQLQTLDSWHTFYGEGNSWKSPGGNLIKIFLRFF